MKQLKIVFLCLFFLSQHVIESKILIITHAFNRPDFLPIQKLAFDSLLVEKDDYEFVVYNDAIDLRLEQEINDTCKKLGLQCIRIPQEIHSRPYLFRLPREKFQASSARVSNVIQYSLHEIGFHHNDIVVIVDSDLFLIKEFSIREYMKGYALAGLPQERQHVKYLWNGLIFMDMPNLPEKFTIDFNCGEVDRVPVDTGGQLHHYLKKHHNLSIHYINEYYPHVLKNKSKEKLPKYGITEKTMKFITIGFDRSALLLDSTFFHYQSAGWDEKGPAYHQKKTAMLNECIKQALS